MFGKENVINFKKAKRKQDAKKALREIDNHWEEIYICSCIFICGLLTGYVIGFHDTGDNKVK